MKPLLAQALSELNALLPRLQELEAPLSRLAESMLTCWTQGGKVLVAGNGGSMADAMHLAEELSVRFQKNRRALAAIALADPSAITCAGNDFGFDAIFSRQIDALGRPGDIFIGLTTSGNSPNLLKAWKAARERNMLTVAFLGKGGGEAKGLCDVELIIPAATSHRVQEGHKILYHVLCEWIDART